MGNEKFLIMVGRILVAGFKLDDIKIELHEYDCVTGMGFITLRAPDDLFEFIAGNTGDKPASYILRKKGIYESLLMQLRD
uniref:Uncharacterized protein n=1 Tax=Klebsiella phage KpTDp1 TaxID=3161143 RepID=A0AAU7YS99_9CAUD